ncbi:ECF transporter S component [Thermosyntropha sp.]|uniref:ECF transporter S component n=1 Tax=Thermosyntropha sp. TaxID=2740820 RepID=UPI0025FF8CE1|nr:ECF transporter S component [Thermosyntropha sp.]MBO8159869.1 ECF transporter S component [Thermosyntropha sp.]
MNWGLASGIIALLVLGVFFLCLGKQEFSALKLVLITTAAAFAAAGRVAFAPVPNVTPSTFITMITGYVWGVQAGAAVGVLSGLISNFFLGQGPWTPWQMIAWGLCGVLGGIVGKNRKELNLWFFVPLCFIAGYFFGFIMNLWHWLTFIYSLSFKSLIGVYIASFPFDTFHAVGNAVFAFFLGKPFFNILLRFKRYIINT